MDCVSISISVSPTSCHWPGITSSFAVSPGEFEMRPDRNLNLETASSQDSWGHQVILIR